jgi:hypothetical protein
LSTLPQPVHTGASRTAAFRPETFIERLGAFLEAHRFAALGLFSAAYFAGMALHARAKPFWNDEIYTVLISGLPDLHSILRALSQGLDGHPPLGYVFVRAARSLPVDLHIAARVPAMIGFWIFCLCLYRFVRRRMGTWPAFGALLLPFAAGASAYALEARSYGLVLGCLGVALVSWQIAADGEHRRWVLPALALALAGALFSHYEAGLIYGPFCGAELFRDFRRRKIDWGIWAAFFAGLLAVLSYLPFIAGQRQYMAHPWAKPHLWMLFDFYENEFRQLIIPGIAFLALAALYYAAFPRRGRTAEAGGATPMGGPRSHEMVIAALFAALPFAGMAAGLLVTHMFTDRYVIATTAGVVLLAVIVVARVSGNSPVLPAILVLVAFGSFMEKTLPAGKFQNPIDKLPLLRQAIARGPVAIEDPLVFFETWYYLPPEMKSRVFFPLDFASADSYIGADTADRTLLAWKPWINISVPSYRGLVKSGKSFLVYYDRDRPFWLLGGLLRDGAQVQLVDWDLHAAVFRATFPVSVQPTTGH